MGNVATVQELYADYQRGDLAAILAKLSPNVDWEYPATSTKVPWLQPRKGREAVAGFFESHGDMEMHRFTPKEFLEGPGVVVVLLDVDFTVKSTGHGWWKKMRFTCGGLIRREK